MNRRKMLELLRLVGAIVLFLLAFGILGLVGYLDRPEDHEDLESWDTPAYQEWLDKRNTNGVSNVKTDETPFW